MEDEFTCAELECIAAVLEAEHRDIETALAATNDPEEISLLLDRVANVSMLLNGLLASAIDLDDKELETLAEIVARHDRDLHRDADDETANELKRKLREKRESLDAVIAKLTSGCATV